MKTEVLDRLIEIIGSDYVLHSAEAIELYSRCTIPWSRKCGAVVFPENADQVSRIVRLCDEHKIPVWTFSRGHNWGYGTVLALQEGALILLLKRMNRIHEVNEELCYAVIEPGVSQGQLSKHLRDIGSRLLVDCTDSTPDGSLIGNALDKGVGYGPYGDHFGTICGMEVVLANGEIFSTGGQFAQCPTRYTYKWGLGPFVDGLFVQSSLGLVVKAGLWLMPKPEAFKMYVLGIANPENLGRAIDAQRELSLRRIVNHCHGFNDLLALTRAFAYPSHLLEGRQFLSDDVIRQFAGEQGLARWTFVGGIHGTPRQVKVYKSEISKHLSPFGRLAYVDDTVEKVLISMVRGIRKGGAQEAFYRTLMSIFHFFVMKLSVETVESLLTLYSILRGRPNENNLAAAYFKNKARQPKENLDPARDGCGLIWFAPILPAIGNEIQDFLEQLKQICAANKFETAVTLVQMNPRTFLVLAALFYRREDREESERAQRTSDDLHDLLRGHGYQVYRCSTPCMETILDANPAYAQLMKKIKQTLDPNQTIAPGRYGT